MFVGRYKELAFLNQCYSSDKAEFVVIYGRRRIGKTALLQEFAREKFSLYYTAVEITDHVQLAKLSDHVLEKLPAPAYTKDFPDWETLFQFIGEQATSADKLVFIIDEFPYMVQNNRGLSSILQKQWDIHLKNRNIMMVLCGSSMSFMEREVLSEKNPLYGRTTGIMKLEEMDFQNARRFMGDGNFQQHLTYYSVYSGVPYYLGMINPSVKFQENLRKSIFSTTSVLFHEPEFLLKQELREVAQYNAIIESVASGDARLNGIHQKTGIERTKLPYYIGNLLDLGILKKEFPVTMKEKERAKSKSGLYGLGNQYFRFYYAFVYPYLSEIQEGFEGIVIEETVMPRIDQYVSLVFEQVAMEQVRLWTKEGRLPVSPLRVGRWWEKDREIDILGHDLKGNYLFGECKWRNEKTGLKTLVALKDKVSLSFPDAKEPCYILFSKSDFTQSLRDEASNDSNVVLVDCSGTDFNIQ